MADKKWSDMTSTELINEAQALYEEGGPREDVNSLLFAAQTLIAQTNVDRNVEGVKTVAVELIREMNAQQEQPSDDEGQR